MKLLRQASRAAITTHRSIPTSIKSLENIPAWRAGCKNIAFTQRAQRAQCIVGARAFTTSSIKSNREPSRSPAQESVNVKTWKDDPAFLGTKKRLPEFSLVDKVVLVSGAARGLGLVQAEALLEAGATGEYTS
jgi:hypothetical protein